VKNPVAVYVDLEHHLLSVRFRTLDEGEKVGDDFLRDPNGDELDVAIARTDAGEIIEIEVLGFDPRVIAVAKSFAEANGLIFPPVGPVIALATH
jgi:hypothetical protein